MRVQPGGRGDICGWRLVNTEEAILELRRRPEARSLIADLYLDEDAPAAARRFQASSEWRAVRDLLGISAEGATVLDLGAGTGVASAAWAAAGARLVLAAEPDPSEVVGHGCLPRMCERPHVVHAFAAVGEALPLASASTDIVYCRQVLHHLTGLDAAMVECARVLRPGGRLIACREHVVDDDRQLARFLADHPIHQLAGGEHAYSLGAYRSAIEGAGLRIERELGPWDSVINAYPTVHRSDDLLILPEVVLARRLGRAGQLLGRLPGSRHLAWRRLRRSKPGRFYSFVATKPPTDAS